MIKETMPRGEKRKGKALCHVVKVGELKSVRKVESGDNEGQRPRHPDAPALTDQEKGPRADGHAPLANLLPVGKPNG